MLDQLEGQQPLAALLLAPMSKPNRFPTAYIPLPFSNGFYGSSSQQEIELWPISNGRSRKSSLLPAMMDMKFGSLMPAAF